MWVRYAIREEEQGTPAVPCCVKASGLMRVCFLRWGDLQQERFQRGQWRVVLGACQGLDVHAISRQGVEMREVLVIKERSSLEM